jgi:hypothetical protein
MNKYSLFDDVEDMLEDRLDIVDGEKVFNGVRLNEEFKKVLLHSKKVFMMDENKLINGRDLDYSNSIVYKISSKNSNKNSKYYCERLGAACDFLITDLPSTELVEWILQTKLPFDSLYFYSHQQPIHISYGIQHKRDIWTFNNLGIPTKKGIENWVKLAKEIIQE